MKLSKGEKILCSVFILVLIMVNPPVINIVNDYCINNPIMSGWPTMLIWLNLWYIVAIVAFLIGALKIKTWKKDFDEKQFKNIKKEG
ncbi:MAG: hypothetical protein LKJ25_02755 [Clostridia bacterium]|jgi:hypothetical protein|nr:hypothetical protein [Clostridia bacterium]